MAAPLVGAESSPTRKAITWAISPGSTQREKSAPGWLARLAGVSMTLGSTVLQRTPDFRYSTATAFAKASTAALAVAYPAAPGNGASAARDETHTTEPPPASTRCGSAAAVTRYVGRRLARRI